MDNEKVHYAELLPHEFRKRLAEKPVAYLPLGTLEWHGEHLPLGADALQSEGLMIECARQLGGIVMPPYTSALIAPGLLRMALYSMEWITRPAQHHLANWMEAATGYQKVFTCR